MPDPTQIVRVRQKATIAVSYNGRSFGTQEIADTLANIDFSTAILTVLQGATPASAITGAELLPVIQSGAGRVKSVNDVVAGAAIITSLQDQIDDLAAGGGGGGGGGGDYAALDARLDTLEAANTTPGSVAYAVKTETDRATAAEVSLDNRIDTLEAGNTTPGSVSYAVKTETDRATAAETGLDGRLDTLEAGNTTPGSVDYKVKAETDRATTAESLIRSEFASADAVTLSSAQSYTDTGIAALVGTAPAILNTLGEIADALQTEQAATTAILTAISNETTRATSAENALDARLDTLEAGNTTPGSVDYKVKVETDRATTAEASLGSRLNTLEAGNTTPGSVAYQVKAEADRATSAETGLGNRLNTLEAGNTTPGSVAYAVKTETDRATAAEAGLQSQITALAPPARYFLTSDYVNSTTTPGNIGLAAPMAANATYEIRAHIIFQSSATTTGLRPSYDCPADAVYSFGQYIISLTPTTSTQISHRARLSTTSTTVSVDTINLNTYATAKFLIRTGSTAGDFNLQFGSEIGASAITIKAGTMMIVTRLQ